MGWHFYLYFGIYLVLLLGVVWWARRGEAKEDFLISGRDRSTWQILLSKFAGTMGVSWFITYMAFAYEFGVAMLAFVPGIIIGYLLFAYWGVPRIYKHSKQDRFYTQGDYIFQRTQSRFARLVTEISAVLVQFGWLIAIIIGGGVVMSTYGFLSFELAVIITTGVVLLYILLAGFKAVIMTDVVQSGVILILVCVLIVIVLRDVSFTEILAIETTSLSFGEVAAFFIFSVLTMFGQADRFQLVYASKNERVAKRGIGFAFIPVFCIAVFLLIAGLFVRAQLPGIDPATAFTELLVTVLPVALLPFGLILFFAGLMSSADTYTFSIASHIGFMRKTAKPVRTIRIATIVLLIVCAGLAILVRDIVDMTIIAAAITVVVSIPTVLVIAGVRSARTYAGTLVAGFIGLVVSLFIVGIDLKIIGFILIGSLFGFLLLTVFQYVRKKMGYYSVRANFNLKHLNTFGVEAYAQHFARVSTIDDVRQVLQLPIAQQNEVYILGGGSNLLLTQDIDGLVIKNELLGKEVLSEDDDTVTVQIMSGENWHDAVMWATDNGWGGIENLALIPGSVGATPVQNIGAYGVEIKNTIERVGVVDMQTGEEKEFSESECHFGYRDSIFKREAKGKYFITYVVLRLSKNAVPVTEYGAIQARLDEMGINSATIHSVRDAVIAIRQAKLPDPKDIGNAGSFFKNPVVDTDTFNKLHENYPDMPSFETAQGIKIPAGWLIEQCDWKGKREGNVGVHDKQALVIVNHGGATGKEIFEFSERIKQSVQEKFGIELEREVTVV